MDDDYYSIIGVDAGASVDDIRNAYRERKDALNAKPTETSKADVAKLNKAWNVLSDPYQRDRYDSRRARALEDGALEDDEDGAPVDASSNGAKRAPAGGRQNARGRQRQLGTPTIKPPAGTHFPSTRQRLTAMIIDLAVILALFAASQFILVSVEKSQQSTAYHDKQTLENTTIPNDNKAVGNAKTALDNANKGTDQQAKQKAQAAYTAAKNRQTADNKKLDSANKKLAPIETVTTLVFFVVALLYLVIPSGLSGRTLGKRTQHLEVLRDDGSPLGWGGAFMRYGSLVLVTYFLSFLLGPIAAVIVLFGVTMWMRNANQQGAHDRLFHTIVVTDAAA